MEQIKKEALKYLEMQIRYCKFELVEQLAKKRARLMVRALLTLIVLVLVFFLGLTLALYLSEILGSLYKGFGVVSLLFALFTIIGFIIRKPMINFFFKDYLDKNIPS
jgi:hypothetical protein